MRHRYHHAQTTGKVPPYHDYCSFNHGLKVVTRKHPIPLERTLESKVYEVYEVCFLSNASLSSILTKCRPIPSQTLLMFSEFSCASSRNRRLMSSSFAAIKASKLSKYSSLDFCLPSSRSRRDCSSRFSPRRSLLVPEDSVGVWNVWQRKRVDGGRSSVHF